MAETFIQIQDRYFDDEEVLRALREIEAHRVWLLEQEAKYFRNPQVARTFQECRVNLEKCGLWTDK